MCKMKRNDVRFYEFCELRLSDNEYSLIHSHCCANVHLCPHSMVVISQPMNEQTNQANEWILDKSYLSIHKTNFQRKITSTMHIAFQITHRCAQDVRFNLLFIFTSIYHASSALITSHFCANFILTIQLNVDLFFRNFNSPIVRIAMQEYCDRLNSTDEWRNQFHLISQLIEQKSVCIFI